MGQQSRTERPSVKRKKERRLALKREKGQVHLSLEKGHIHSTEFEKHFSIKDKGATCAGKKRGSLGGGSYA